MKLNSICAKAFLFTSLFAVAACISNNNQGSEQNGVVQLANDTIEISQSL